MLHYAFFVNEFTWSAVHVYCSRWSKKVNSLEFFPHRSQILREWFGRYFCYGCHIIPTNRYYIISEKKYLYILQFLDGTERNIIKVLGNRKFNKQGKAVPVLN
jgi:hypothetical protein